MKNTIIALALATATVSVASAQNTISWDFSPYAFDGFSSLDGANLTGAVNSNYLDNLPAFQDAAQYGTMYYDGQFGSTAFNLGASEVSPNGGLDTAVANNGSLGFAGNLTLLSLDGQQFANPKAYGLTTNGSFTFALTDFTDLTQLQYAAYNNTDAASSIQWSTSTDGVNFTNLELDNISNSATEYLVDLTSVSDAAFVRGTLSGLDANLFALDNVTISGTVVPEPSTYAAIAGALALAFVAYRRRK